MLQKRYAVACLAIFAVLFSSLGTFHYMVIFWSFFAGVGLCMLYLRPGYNFPNFYVKLIKETPKPSIPTVLSDCSVCGNKNCNREKRIEGVELLRPWEGIHVNHEVNIALEEFINLLIKQHIDIWYSDISQNECFKNEIRLLLRHCLSVLYRRINNIDLPEVIIKKLIKVAIFHMHICLSAQSQGYKNEDDILIYYGSKLHSSMKNRRVEINYLRNACERLLPFLLPDYIANSRISRIVLREILSSNVFMQGLDALADPDNVNHLLLLFFDDSPTRQADKPPSPMEPFLCRLDEKHITEGSVLSAMRVELPDLLQQQDMLYQFMSFLKSHGAVHVLQFCLTIEDFNRRCLAQQKSAEVQKEFKDLFQTYFTSTSSNYIHFDEAVTDELSRMVSEPWQDNFKLRMSGPMFSAYEQAYNLLEHVYCPLFYQSDTYYKMICGRAMPKLKQLLARNESIPRLSPQPNRKFSQKMKDVFRSSPNLSEYTADVNGNETDNNFLNGSTVDAESLLVDLNESDHMDNHQSRDLSSWRITIPHVEPVTDDGEKFFAFGIRINKVSLTQGDNEPEQWWSLRRYSEFYVLESKLTQFHGSLTPAHLPPKKLFSRSYEFHNERKNEFERFLKALISKPVLRQSQLLFDFLKPTSKNKTSQFENKLLPDVKLGRFFKKVPNKIIKERGQHLEVFFQALVQSCEALKPKPGKNNAVVDNPSVIMDEKLQNELYPDSDWQWDSCDVTHDSLQDNADLLPLDGVFDYILYFAYNVFKVPEWLFRSISAVKIVLRNTIEPLVHSALKTKIDLYRQEHHVVHIIHLFRDVLFFDNDPMRTKLDKETRRSETTQELKLLFPPIFQNVIGAENYEAACENFIQLIQMPKLNKQLSYLLLDVFIQELFPELKPGSPSS